MTKIDNLIQFIFDHRNDDRVHIEKHMKYGYKYYYLNFEIDQDEDDKKFHMTKVISFVFDNRNSCIEIQSGGERTEIIEDTNLLNKWSKILDDYLSDGLEDRIMLSVESSLSKCFRKDIYREYQMGKLLDNI